MHYPIYPQLLTCHRTNVSSENVGVKKNNQKIEEIRWKKKKQTQKQTQKQPKKSKKLKKSGEGFIELEFLIFNEIIDFKEATDILNSNYKSCNDAIQ